MDLQKITFPYVIKPSQTSYVFLAVFFGLFGVVIAIASLWKGGLEELKITYPVVLFFPALALIFSGVIKVFKIVIYNDRISYRLSLIQGTRTMFYKDIETIERSTRITPQGPIPLLRIQNKANEIIDLPVTSFSDKDIGIIIDITSKANAGIELSELVRETKEGSFKWYSHYTKTWKRILWYGLWFAFLFGIINALGY